MAKARYLLLAVYAGLWACSPEEAPQDPPEEPAALEENGLYFAEENFLAEHYAERGGPPWYDQEQLPVDLQGALADDRRFLGEDNAGRRMMGDAQMCRTLRQVSLACDYSTRTTLVIFLAVNGHNLFPSESDYAHGRPGSTYSGKAAENQVLRAAVERNARLFRDGNLTAEDVRTRWR